MLLFSVDSLLLLTLVYGLSLLCLLVCFKCVCVVVFASFCFRFFAAVIVLSLCFLIVLNVCVIAMFCSCWYAFFFRLFAVLFSCWRVVGVVSICFCLSADVLCCCGCSVFLFPAAGLLC